MYTPECAIMHLMSGFNYLLSSPSYNDATLIIHDIDIGHGDASLIQYNDKSLLIGAGSNDIGDTVPT